MGEKLDTGAVSFGLIWGFLRKQEEYLRRLRYIVDTVPDDECGESHLLIHDVVSAAKKDYDAVCEEAKQEKDRLGGNNVYVSSREGGAS